MTRSPFPHALWLYFFSNYVLVDSLARAIGPGGWGRDPWKYVGGVRLRVCSDPRNMSHSFIQNCCWITLQVSHRQGWKTCVKMEGKTNFLRCRKQFDGWIWLTPPYILPQMYVTHMTVKYTNMPACRLLVWLRSFAAECAASSACGSASQPRCVDSESPAGTTPHVRI